MSCKINDCVSVYPLSSQYLEDAPLSSITALSLCGWVSIRFAHLDTAILFFIAKLLQLCQVAQRSDVNSAFQVQPQILTLVKNMGFIMYPSPELFFSITFSKSYLGVSNTD